MKEKQIGISIVSHGQLALVTQLLNNLQAYCADNIDVILTLNLPEAVPEIYSAYTFPINIIKNTHPKGFAANHNAAFQRQSAPYFCVLNPDIKLIDNPFELLRKDCQQKSIGVVAPKVIDEQGVIQDSARKFPTVIKLLKRVLLRERSLDYDMTQSKIFPDWVGGMFMLFRREVYAELNGFDEKYYLYCEDIDLCARLKQKNYLVLQNNRVQIIHLARRDSHQKLQYLWWHLKSLLRYFYRRSQ